MLSENSGVLKRKGFMGSYPPPHELLNCHLWDELVSERNKQRHSTSRVDVSTNKYKKIWQIYALQHCYKG